MNSNLRNTIAEHGQTTELNMQTRMGRRSMQRRIAWLEQQLESVRKCWGIGAPLRWLVRRFRGTLSTEEAGATALKAVSFLDLPPFEIEVYAKGDAFISVDILRYGVWEPFETMVFRRMCEPSSTVVDIGANVGWHSLVAGYALGPEGRVIAVEPEPGNLELLRRNASRAHLKNISVDAIALGRKGGAGQLVPVGLEPRRPSHVRGRK